MSISFRTSRRLMDRFGPPEFIIVYTRRNLRNRQQFLPPSLSSHITNMSLASSNSQSSVNLERTLDHDEDPLAITTADAVSASGVPPWNWGETPSNGGEGQSSYGGRVITVKWGDFVQKIGIDGTAEAIKASIKSAFGLRTKRTFWLEDEDNVIRSLDRDMPLGNYILHLDEGICIKVCMSTRTEEKTFYREFDFHKYLWQRGLIGLREMNGYKILDNLDDLRAGAMYQGVRLLGD